MRRNVVEGTYHVVESVSHDLRRRALAAVEGTAEVVKRLMAVRELANQGVSFQPNQKSFRIKVHAAPPASELGRRSVENLGGIGGILQRAPAPSRGIVEGGGSFGGFIQELLRGPQAAARRQDVTPILREPFVHP